MKAFPLVLLLVAQVAVVHALSLDFCGYVRFADGEVLFAFKDRTSKVSSPWMKVGQRWKGWALVDFDSLTESVELTANQKSVRLRLASSDFEVPVNVPSFEGGNFTLADGTVVYSHDAVLHIGKMKVSSPSGVMVANGSGEQVAGDLIIDTPQGTFKTTEASIHLVDGHPEVVAKTMVLQTQNSQTGLTSR
jgi:hypothetical protein